MADQVLHTEIGDYSHWRERLRQSVQDLSQFLKNNNVTDLRTHHQFERVLGALDDDSLSVAFVAEFSRGKSEMINTIFFGDYKKRMLPSGTGRTTMCPTELRYNPDEPSGVKLLPIESRRDQRALFELRKDHDIWEQVTFDADDIASISEALQAMTQSKLVSKAYAKDLKFDLQDEQESQIGLPINEYDEVEIPSWRHAIINLPHPLLEKGLVILDTPGLNAIGAEPELTINQLATAHTVVFILSHDSGVTASDLKLWENHLGGEGGAKQRNQRKLVALNKIDSLWDGIRSKQEIDEEIKKQVKETASTLNLDPENIFPVSAQKGLLAKLSDDQDLLARSNITSLESAIADKLIPEKRKIVVDKVRVSLEGILDSASSVLDNRLKDADEHIAELKQLSSKNTDVIAHIMVKVQSEKASLEKDMQRYQALRSVYNKETGKLARILSEESLEKLIATTRHQLARCASSITLQKTIGIYFRELNKHLERAMSQANEIAALSENITRDFETEHGIANFRVRRLRLERFQHEIQRLESKHSDLKQTKTLFFKEQMSITNRFYESVCTASRKIFGRARRDANNWNNNLMVPMETYVREHHTQLRRRLESVKRIHKASDTVEARLNELTQMKQQLQGQHDQFTVLQNQLVDLLIEASQADTPAELRDVNGEILYWEHKTSF